MLTKVKTKHQQRRNKTRIGTNAEKATREKKTAYYRLLIAELVRRQEAPVVIEDAIIWNYQVN